MTKLYISGPMSNYPEHNYPAFFEAAETLRNLGYDVVNPAELGVVDGWKWADYLRRDLRVMLDCDGVATLDGWTKSKGARLEVDVAEELDMPIDSVDAWLPCE